MDEKTKGRIVAKSVGLDTSRIAFELLFTIILFIHAISECSPLIASTGVKNIIWIVSYMAVFACALIGRGNRCRWERSDVLVYLLLTLMAVYPFLFDKLTMVNRYLALSGILVYPIIYNQIKHEYKRVCKSTISILCIWSVYVCLRTIYVIQTVSPWAAREADKYFEYQIIGCGGYSFIYSISIGAVIVFCSLLQSKTKKWIAIRIFLFLIYTATIIKANFITAIVVELVGIVFAFIYQYRRNSIILKRYLVVLFLFTVVYLSGPLLTELYRLSAGERGRILEALKNNDNIVTAIVFEFFNDRLQTLSDSIIGLLNNFMIGQIPSSESIMWGQHSTFLDTFALFGFPVSALYFYYAFRQLLAKESKKAFSVPLAMAFFTIIFFNNADASILFTVLFIGMYYSEREMNYEENSYVVSRE